MTALAVLYLFGLVAGFLLLLRVPSLNTVCENQIQSCSIIIPARNEALTVPHLLESIRDCASNHPDVLVVDDHSTDDTAAVATQHGARVLASPPLRTGWTGKTSCCVAGSLAAEQDLLLFLDADTWFEPAGLKRLLSFFANFTPGTVAVSVLPFHVTYEPYEEMSLFFNLMTAFGAGGFGAFGSARLFGQSLLLDRALYLKSGTHEAVRGEILENFALAPRIVSAGGHCVCLGGRGVLRMRMFPEGFGQLCEGWTKAFASGAAASESIILLTAVLWLTALFSAFLCLLFASSNPRAVAAAFYLAFVLQTAWFGRQVGSYRWYSFLLYPIPLIFFFIIFGRSLKRRVLKQTVTWKGRQV